MALNQLLNQSVTIYNKSGLNSEGRETFGAITTVRARFQNKTAYKLLPDGSTLITAGIAYVPPATTVSVGDKVVYGSEIYKVLTAYATPDGQGNTNHIKLELIKWRQT